MARRSQVASPLRPIHGLGLVGLRLAAWQLVAFGLAWAASAAMSLASDDSPRPLRMLVMDPLSRQLACDCVAGYAQRDYDRLGEFLTRVLDRTVAVDYAESLSDRHAPSAKQIDLLIGKSSVVRYDAQRAALRIRVLAMLTDADGKICHRGLFVVRHDDPARSIAELAGRRVRFGPRDSDEKHAAAFDAWQVFGHRVPARPELDTSCSTAAVAVVEHDADAAVISSYALPLLQGCGAIDRGALRIVGETAAVPFVGVFATDRISTAEARTIQDALRRVRERPELLKALESRSGFLRLDPAADNAGHSWPDWRGANRDGISPDVPRRLPKSPQLLWSRVLTGHGLAGVAVQGDRVIVADKSLEGDHDIFRCLDADRGTQYWTVEYPAPGKMDFTNSPRANPVIRDGLVYLLGAYGHLHCVDLAAGHVVWKRHLAEDFDARVPTWGYCSAPLIHGRNLIVNPGAEDASVVALDRQNGRVVWKASGDPPGYAGFISATIQGVSQIIGYEAAALCGWDPLRGRRLWRHVPAVEGDFNVPTPILVGERLLISSENNGTRLHAFDPRGCLIPDPIATSDDLYPDTSTPIVYRGMVLGHCGGLVCLDLDGELRTLWEAFEDPYFDYCAFVAGNDRILVVTQTGGLRLLAADKDALKCVSSLDLFDDVSADDRDVWSLPAVVGNRLYIRNSLAVYCYLLGD